MSGNALAMVYVSAKIVLHGPKKKGIWLSISKGVNARLKKEPPCITRKTQTDGDSTTT